MKVRRNTLLRKIMKKLPLKITVFFHVNENNIIIDLTISGKDQYPSYTVEAEEFIRNNYTALGLPPNNSYKVKMMRRLESEGYDIKKIKCCTEYM